MKCERKSKFIKYFTATISYETSKGRLSGQNGTVKPMLKYNPFNLFDTMCRKAILRTATITIAVRSANRFQVFNVLVDILK